MQYDNFMTMYIVLCFNLLWLCFDYRSGNLVMVTREEMMTLRIGFWKFLKIQVQYLFLLLLSRHWLVLLWLLPVTMWMLHVHCTPHCDNKKWQEHSTAVLMTPFFMYFRCTRTNLMSSH